MVESTQRSRLFFIHDGGICGIDRSVQHGLFASRLFLGHGVSTGKVLALGIDLRT